MPRKENQSTASACINADLWPGAFAATAITETGRPDASPRSRAGCACCGV